LTLATMMGVFFTPVLYRLIQGLSELRRPLPTTAEPPKQPAPPPVEVAPVVKVAPKKGADGSAS